MLLWLTLSSTTLPTLSGCCSQPQGVPPLGPRLVLPEDRTAELLRRKNQWKTRPDGWTEVPTVDMLLLLRDRGEWAAAAMAAARMRRGER